MLNVSRSILLTALGLGAAIATQARADDPVDNPLVMIQAKDVFVPVGFDDNDQSLAVIDGYLPGTCYRLAYVQTTFDAAAKTFHVTQYARKFSQAPCIEVLVPFTSEVSFGALKAAAYGVEAYGAGHESLVVKEALGPSPDDYLYAPIDTARVEQDPATGRYVGTIEGRLTNSCLAFQEIRVTDSGKTLEILPIIAMADQGNCAASEVPFSKSFLLPAGMQPGRHLLHVRSLNGKAVNVVFTVNVPQT
jgi:hypothetical protein